MADVAGGLRHGELELDVVRLPQQLHHLGQLHGRHADKSGHHTLTLGHSTRAVVTRKDEGHLAGKLSVAPIGAERDRRRP
jgi:hypothetical protein